MMLMQILFFSLPDLLTGGGEGPIVYPIDVEDNGWVGYREECSCSTINCQLSTSPTDSLCVPMVYRGGWLSFLVYIEEGEQIVYSTGGVEDDKGDMYRIIEELEDGKRKQV